MSRGAEHYNWAAYYEAAYEKERKQNIVLAERIADAERRQADLSDNLDRICATPFWKMTVPFRTLHENIKDRLQQHRDKDRCSVMNACLLRYTEEVQRQKLAYREWIRKEEGDRNSDGRYLNNDAIPVSEWEAVRIPESDIVLLTYGGGVLAPDIFTKIKSYFDQNKSCVIAYTDEDFYWENLSHRMQPWFKPCYSPDTLLSYNCWGHLVAVKEDLLTEVLKEDGVRGKILMDSILPRGRDQGEGKLQESKLQGSKLQKSELQENRLQESKLQESKIQENKLQESNSQDRSLSDDEEKSDAVKLAIRFYNLCLYLEEAVIRQCQLRGTPASDNICHIPGVLFHRRYEPDEKVREKIAECDTEEERYIKAEEYLKEELEGGLHLIGSGAEYVAVREAALYRRGKRGSLQCGPEPDIYHIVYDTSISGRDRCARAQSVDGHIQPHPLVSVVIPSRDHPEVLEQCLKSFRKKTLYDYYEWIVVDNGSNEENRNKIAKLQKEYKFLYLYEEMPFNFSKMCNMGVARAKGDLILLLNDDIEIIEKSWLGRMVGQALQPHVGAVGAKLWYAGTRQIQHVGITNLRIGPSHKLVTFKDDQDYYYGRNRVVYDMIGITAACLMVTKRKYEEVGGLDEDMAVSYNDVDFCFKLWEAGYYNVLRNDAVLYHHESLSRGLDEHDENKWERLLSEKRNLYARHPQLDGKDPFYHEELIDNASDYRCNYKFDYEDSKHTVEVMPLQGEVSGAGKEERLKLIVDRAEMQHKIQEAEEDIVWIMGWCYVPGADNAFYDKKIVLQRMDGGGYTAVPADWNRKDVEESLRGEQHIELAGFVARVLKRDLQAGTYRIGMLCTNRVYGDKAFAWSERGIKISGE